MEKCTLFMGVSGSSIFGPLDKSPFCALFWTMSKSTEHYGPEDCVSCVQSGTQRKAEVFLVFLILVCISSSMNSLSLHTGSSHWVAVTADTKSVSVKGDKAHKGIQFTPLPLYKPTEIPRASLLRSSNIWGTLTFVTLMFRKSLFWGI